MLSRRIGDDWRNLANYFDIPLDHRQRFKQGYECQEIWEWLERRNKLEGIKDALVFIGRDDLIETLEISSEKTTNFDTQTTDPSNKLSFPEYTSFQQDLENLIGYAKDNFSSVREDKPSGDSNGITGYKSQFSFEYSTNNMVWEHNGRWYFTCTFCKDTTLQQAKIIFDERIREIKSALSNEWKFEEREQPDNLYRKIFEATKKYNVLRIEMVIVAFDQRDRTQVNFKLEQLNH